MSVPKQIEKAIFDVALELDDPQVRAGFLGQACNGNTALRAEIEELLAVHESAKQFFAVSPVQAPESASRPLAEVAPIQSPPTADTSEPLNTVIGRYRLLQRLGEGGCGVVYLADQLEPVRRRVALKIIRLGMDTEGVIARFAAERQALAMMDHPNIAHVLDAGATESGRPYFVMELVDGVKITDYCNQKNLDTRERLHLFIQVCHAIQHAHQKGIIHRDIKPSNILVTMHDGAPVPKVIDFGIAKAVEGRITDDTLHTATDQFVGTPAYMSPEQADMSGLDMDTRSDIYSMGILLYELLAGQPPFDSKELVKGGLEEMRRTLREQEPQLPSTLLTTLGNTKLRAVAVQRHAEPLRLISTMRGDLDWIVMKALEKDRSRRYETANGLAVDVQRFLDNEPIVARPQSGIYRLKKLVRRNRITFLAIAAVTLALVAGISISTWLYIQQREATKRAVLAEKQEAGLRQAAENRALITQAAFFISQDKLEAADDLVGNVSEVGPSLEVESVLRMLGQWNALRGHWPEAAKQFSLLLEADQRDKSDQITYDLLMAGPILLEHGDVKGYDHFRRVAIARFVGTTDPVFAERTIRVSLLIPGDAELMNSLEPFARLSKDSMEKGGNDLPLEAWRCVALGLVAYRQDFSPAAKKWCQQALSYSENNPARNCMAHLIQAMACAKLGEMEKARSELAAGRRLIDEKFAAGLDMGRGEVGMWYDWLFDRIFLREASALIAGPGN